MQVRYQAQFRAINSIGHLGRCTVLADSRPFREENAGDRPLPARRLQRRQEDMTGINREQ